MTSSGSFGVDNLLNRTTEKVKKYQALVSDKRAVKVNVEQVTDRIEGERGRQRLVFFNPGLQLHGNATIHKYN